MVDNNNFNGESFNEDFCTHLEYHLSETFKNSNRENIKGFWCDGVSWNPIPLSQIGKKSVNDSRKIETEAWTGKTGQDKYKMTILLGKYSLRKYAKGISLIDCIPSSDTMDWINIDTEKKTIEITLK